MKAIILLAGHGTRMRPLTYYINKGMIPVAGRPLMEYILIKLRDQGFAEFIAAVTDFPEQLRHYFGDGARWDVDIHYVERPQPSQTAGEVAAMRELLADEEAFLVHYGDIICNLDAAAMARKHLDTGAAATIGVVTGVRFHAGVAQLDEDDRVVDFIEKPPIGKPTHAAINIFSSRVLDYCAPGKDFATDVIPEMIANGEKVIGYLDTEAYWYDVGRLSDLETVSDFLAERGREW